MTSLLMYSTVDQERLQAIKGLINESNTLINAVLRTEAPCPLQRSNCEKINILLSSAALLAKSCSYIEK